MEYLFPSVTNALLFWARAGETNGQGFEWRGKALSSVAVGATVRRIEACLPLNETDRLILYYGARAGVSVRGGFQGYPANTSFYRWRDWYLRGLGYVAGRMQEQGVAPKAGSGW